MSIYFLNIKCMDSILVNDKISKYFNKLVKQNENFVSPYNTKMLSIKLSDSSFYDKYIRSNTLLIFLIISFVVYLIFQNSFFKNKKNKKYKSKKFTEKMQNTISDNYSTEYENNTVFSEEDRENLIKIIDDLTIENYKQSIKKNTTQVPRKIIKEMNGNLNGDFVNINNSGKYNSVINGIIVESPFV